MRLRLSQRLAAIATGCPWIRGGRFCATRTELSRVSLRAWVQSGLKTSRSELLQPAVALGRCAAPVFVASATTCQTSAPSPESDPTCAPKSASIGLTFRNHGWMSDASFAKIHIATRREAK